jgi:hypothetical protein
MFGADGNTVGKRLVEACMASSKRRMSQDVKTLLVKARTAAKKATTRMDASEDIPSGCKATICLCIATRVVVTRLCSKTKPREREAVERVGGEVASERGIGDSFKRRYNDIGRLVEKFSC